jgi:acetyl-CoA C-acetyltransferase
MKGDQTMKKEKNPEEIVLVGGVRTPFGKFGGVLRDVESVDLGASVIKEVLKRANVPGSAIDEVFYGFSIISEPYSDGKGDVPDRRAVLKAGLPPETLSLSLNKACCSSLTAVQLGIRTIKVGEGEVILAVGADNMGRAPFLVSSEVRWGVRMGHVVAYNNLFELGYRDFEPVSVDAGEVALEFGVTREEQDEYAFRSQNLYAEAEKQGKFAQELMALEIPQKKAPPIIFDKDECPKPYTTIEKLRKLPTVYGSPTVTAGNAPGLDAGAAAVLIMTRQKADELNVPVLASIVCASSYTMEPRMIAAVPAPTIMKVLRLAGLELDDMAMVEINEAFAAMPLVSSKILVDELYGGCIKKLQALRDKINVDGGCIAIGHPVGASGARILMHLAYELKRRGGGYGVAAICGGLAQGAGAIIRVD